MPFRPKSLQIPKNLTGAPLAMINAELMKREAAAAGDPRGVVQQERVPLRKYLPGAWRHVSSKPLLPNWHLDAMADHLTAVSDGDIPKLIINMPPGLAKSVVTSVIYPTWEWGPNVKPQTRFLCASYVSDSKAPALRDADIARNLINTSWYQNGWGTVYALSATQNSKEFYRNDKLGYRLSGGLKDLSGQRGDILLIDDPTNLDDWDDLKAIMEPSQVWESSLQSRIIDDGSAVILVMQRLHDEDLAGYFLKQDGWIHLKLPMFYEEEFKTRVFLHGKLFFEDPRTHEGQPLHGTMTRAIQQAETQRKSRPDIYCTPAETPILMADWTTKPISEVKAGDSVIGFAPTRGPRTKGDVGYNRMRFTPTVVSAVSMKAEDTVWDVTMASGRTVRCTADHRWFTGRRHNAGGGFRTSTRKDTHAPYLPAAVGRSLCFVCEPHDSCSPRELLDWFYLAGLIDGEGSVKQQGVLKLSQSPDANADVFDAIDDVLRRLKFDYVTDVRAPRPTPTRMRSGRSGTFVVHNSRDVYRRLLRFVPNFGKRQQVIDSLFWSGQMRSDADRVVDIKRPIVEPVYALETGTGNYIAWGYASKNSAQQQQRPAPLEGTTIKKDWIQQWLQPPTIIDETIIVLDCAFKKAEDNSFVVMQCWSRRGSNAFLMDQVREHLDLPETIERFRAFCIAHPEAAAKWVEDKANGPGVVQSLKGQIPGLMTTTQDEEGELCLKKFCQGSKESKLSSVAPYFQARNIWINPTLPQLNEYIYELTTFPRSRFDDQVDCTAMAVWKLLSSFAVFVPASEVVLRGTNIGTAVGVFDRAYGSTPQPSEMDVLAYGRAASAGAGDLARRAYGG